MPPKANNSYYSALIKPMDTSNVIEWNMIVPEIEELPYAAHAELQERIMELQEKFRRCYTMKRDGTIIPREVDLPNVDDFIPSIPPQQPRPKSALTSLWSMYQVSQGKLNELVYQYVHQALINQSSTFVSTFDPLLTARMKGVMQAHRNARYFLEAYSRSTMMY